MTDLNITTTTGMDSTLYEAEGTKTTTEVVQTSDGTWMVHLNGVRYQGGCATREEAETYAHEALVIELMDSECSWCAAPATGTAVAEDRMRYNSCGANDHGYNYWD